ncbi:MAG: bifunctional ornithine acetyltransferase/N-acetylglutamate synthase [Christensenella sp.]|nr:bifunctional ornithine acetyltransferase/N-acetylglutamate synthase [Christensenella sp.]
MSVCKNGVGVAFDEDKATDILNNDEVLVYVNCNQGNKEATAWGCDLTYEYVKINAEYRT